MTKTVPADSLANDAFLGKRRPNALLQNAVWTEWFLPSVPNGGKQKIQVACVGGSLSPFEERAEHKWMERHGTAGRLGFRLSDSVSDPGPQNIHFHRSEVQVGPRQSDHFRSTETSAADQQNHRAIADREI